jgi:hypothetical protein
MNSAPYGKEGAYIAKQINLPGDWWKPWSNEAAALWIEGMQIAEFNFTLQNFKLCAQHMDVEIYSAFGLWVMMHLLI